MDEPWIILGEDDEITAPTLLFYGASGVGKTRLVGQWPDVLILACDPGAYGGAISARKFRPKVKIIRSYQEIFDFSLTCQKYIGKEIKALAIDSLSYLQRIIMADILTKSLREVPRVDEWGLCAQRMRKLIVKLSEYNCVTIFTCTEQIVKDEISGKLIGGPNLPGKLAQELPQACDIVLRLSATTSLSEEGVKVVYKFQSTPDDIWYAKDRLNILPPMAEVDIKHFEPFFKPSINQLKKEVMGNENKN